MKILISSINPSTRERWRKIIEEDGYQIVEASSVQETLVIIQQEPVDLILLHRSMVDIDFFAKIKGTRFFIFSDLPDDNEAYASLKLGAIGYANTYIAPRRLQEAIQTALAGRVWVGQKLMQKIIRGVTGGLIKENIETVPEHNLSEREWEVALWVSKGQSNLEIAAELDISERTVKAHISSIFKKTKTESRLQIALYVKNLLTEKS